MKPVIALLIAAAFLAGPAAANPPGNEPLTADVMQAELFGIQMSGIVVGTGQTWTECIEPGGRTLYEIGGTRAEGILEITPDALACFTYPGTGASCFRGQRSPRGYLFREVGGSAVFHATKVERGVQRCITSDLVG